MRITRKMIQTAVNVINIQGKHTAKNLVTSDDVLKTIVLDGEILHFKTNRQVWDYLNKFID